MKLALSMLLISTSCLGSAPEQPRVLRLPMAVPAHAPDLLQRDDGSGAAMAERSFVLIACEKFLRWT